LRRGRVRAEIAFGCTIHDGKHGVSFYDAARAWVLAALVTDTGARGKGEASAALNSIIEIAKKASAMEYGPKRLYLEPCPMARKYGAGLKKPALIAWYARRGFVSQDEHTNVMMMELA
jgi:GNAT superfamily N-acetyltransferase